MTSLQPYYIFLVPLIVGGFTQILKFVLFSLKHGWDIRYALTHGHMPSAHTAFMTSLVTSIGLYEGMHTGAFAVAIAMFFIVIDDAARLRMYMGDQGRYLNMLIRQLDVDTDKFPRLKERVGHRMSEVMVGGLLGFFLTVFLAEVLR